MAQITKNELGFKVITVENWLKPDPVWTFGVEAELSSWANDWVQAVLELNLAPSVPLEVRKLFETARGAMVYSPMFYPLLTIGSEQVFRVHEAAVSMRCVEMGAPSKLRSLRDKISWLTENGTISREDKTRWDAVRHMRNVASHPSDQSIHSPAMAIMTLEASVSLINSLFASV